MGSLFYRGSECCALIFDLSEAKTFETLDQWRSEFLSQLNPKEPDSYPFVVIGNKSDKENERQVFALQRCLSRRQGSGA
jgi:Ras-related protein Rab-7A